MKQYRVHMYNLAVAPLGGTNPPPPHPEIKKCDSLEEADAIAVEYKDKFEQIKVYAPDDELRPIFEYRNGLKYIKGKRVQSD